MKHDPREEVRPEVCRPLPRGRGLKLVVEVQVEVAAGSPPPTGAWIETAAIMPQHLSS